MTTNNISNDEHIYIILIRALTGLGTISRKLTRYEYSHIAVSFDESLTDFISFSRRKHYVPFDAGIMHEYRSYYAFGDNDKFKAKVFRLKVNSGNLKKIKKYIKEIESDSDYLFNIYSMITMPLIHGFRIYKAHNCMSFVGSIIEKTESIEMKKPYYKYDIKDIDILLEKYLFFEGFLKKDNEEKFNYMDKTDILKNISLFIRLNVELTKRMFFRSIYKHK